MGSKSNRSNTCYSLPLTSSDSWTSKSTGFSNVNFHTSRRTKIIEDTLDKSNLCHFCFSKQQDVIRKKKMGYGRPMGGIPYRKPPVLIYLLLNGHGQPLHTQHKQIRRKRV